MLAAGGITVNALTTVAESSERVRGAQRKVALIAVLGVHGFHVTLSAGMAEPIDYQTPLPAGYRLRYIISDEGVRISRGTPGNGLLWAEAGAPLILLLSFIGFSIFIWRLPRFLNFPTDGLLWFYVVGYGFLAVWFVANGRRAWQNVGIVTEIAVSGEALYWCKKNLWGTKEYFWPLSSIHRIAVHNRLLRVHRHRGPALAAFSFVKSEERAYASMLLTEAIHRHRKTRV